MRNLNANEIKDMQKLDDRQSDPGDRWVEATATELANAGVGTACGGPDTFVILAANKYHARKVRGCIKMETDEAGNQFEAMSQLLAIKIQTEKTANKIEQILDQNGSYIRFDGPADSTTSLKGFMIFEDE